MSYHRPRIICSFENITLKDPLNKGAIWLYHLTSPMLNSMTPLTDIFRAVCPSHLAKTVSFIIFVLSFVYIPTRPLKDSISMFPVVFILALILIYSNSVPAATLPFAFAMFYSILEFSKIGRAIDFPSVLTLTMCLAIFEITLIGVSVCKEIYSSSML